jgi:hypothetical protein
VHAGELEVLGAAPGRDVDDARALLEGYLLPGDDAMLKTRGGREVVEGTFVAQADELGAAGALAKRRLRVPRDGDPGAVLAESVIRIRLDRGSDVRQTASACPGQSASGNLTKRDGSVRSS